MNWAIGLMSRVFTNGLEDLVSIPGRVIPKTKKMVLDAALLNTQHYKVSIKGIVEQSREWSSALSYTCVVTIKKGASGHPWLKLPNLLLLIMHIYNDVYHIITNTIWTFLFQIS